MGTIPPPTLLQLWAVEDLTIEQAIGHLLQHLVIVRNELNNEQMAQPKLQVQVEEALTELQTIKARQDQLRADVDQLLWHAGLSPAKVKCKSSRKRKQ